MIALIRRLMTADGRTYVGGLWRIVRANHQIGATLTPTTPTVTMTMLRPDGTLHRIHNVPSGFVDDAVDFAAQRGETVIVAEER